MDIILGIDPGSRVTGYGVIRSNGNYHQYITSGVIKTQGENVGERLSQIYSGISDIIRAYSPLEAAIEEVFVAKNPRGALKLGQARGTAIVAMANQGLLVAEYSARVIKQAVTGYGAADKIQVQQMVKLLLNLSKAPVSDAADALGVAICHAQTRIVTSLLKRLQQETQRVSS